MRRLVVAILCLILAAPIIAQVPTPANMAAQLAEQSAKREEAERKLLIREAADELEAAQTEQAYNRFEIWTGILMGAFSVLITVLVIVFGFRTEKAASAAAKQEVADAKADILGLLDEARDAAAAAKAAQKVLAATKAEIDALLISTQSAATEAEKNVARTRVAAEIVENRGKIPTAEQAANPFSPAEKKIVKAAAEGSADKADGDLTVDEYKARIGNARYIDEDWTETLRLARAMAKVHKDNDEALAFALNAQGDAQRELNRHDEAVEAYDRVTKRFCETSDADVQQHLMWAMHHKGYSLNELSRSADAEAELRALLPLRERVDGTEHYNTIAVRHESARAILDQGRAADAEAEFRALLPVCERVIGAEHSDTLTTRHGLARAILEQGRAADAEAAFRALLPLCERVDGAEYSGTHVTRYCLARAVLENGKAAEAAEILAPIPESPGNADWLERSSAQLAFTRARVADALGDDDAAARWLGKAKEHFAAALPPDHYYRQQFDDYVAAREARAS
jgi:Tetratricopeptide repeat